MVKKKTDKNKWNEIETCVIVGQKNMVNLLIREHADVNIPNNIGWTPLFAAARFGDSFNKLLKY